MTNPMPLNGDRLLNAAASALATPKPSAARLLRKALEGDHTDEDAPDGTGAATKSYPSGRPQSAVDPSQGHGGSPRTGPTDPLHRALERLLLNR